MTIKISKKLFDELLAEYKVRLTTRELGHFDKSQVDAFTLIMDIANPALPPVTFRVEREDKVKH